MQMVAPRRKKFAGKWFDFQEGFEYKTDADRAAIHMRSGSVYNVRVVKIPGIRGYFLYARTRPLLDRRSR